MLNADLRGGFTQQHDASLLGALLQAAPLAIALLDLADRIVLWNPAAETLFGWQATEVLDKPNPLVPLAPHEPKIPYAAQTLGSRIVTNQETVLQRKDGAFLDVSLSSAPVHDATGQFAGRLLIVADNTAHPRAEAGARSRNRALLALQDVMLKTGAETHLPDVLATILAQAQALLDAQRGGGIYLYESATDSLRLVHSSGINRGRDGVALHRGEGVVGRVLQTMRPLVVDNYTQWEGRAAILVADPPSTVLGAPLLLNDEVIGVLTLIANSQLRQFGELDLQQAEIFAAQAAVAIQTARLYAQAQQELAERRLAEAALLESEARYRSLVENQFELVSRSALDGHLTFVNDAYCQAFGITRQALIGQEFTFSVLPEDLAVVQAAAQALRVPPHRAYFETRNLTVRGPRWFEWVSSAVLDEHGNVVEFQGIGRDVTDRVNATAQLRDNEAFRKRVFESSPMPIIIMDAETSQFIECNPAAVEVYRYASVEAVIGKTPLDVSAPVQYDGVASQAKLRDVLDQAQTNGYVKFAWRHQRPDGEIWDAEVHLLSFQSGDHNFIQGTLQDVTARRSMELAIRERVKELTCLFRVGRLLEDHRATTETICNGIVTELAPAMQYPQAAIPILVLDGVRYAAGADQADLVRAVCADIEVGRTPRGQIRVFYTGSESFIIPEEQNLLDNIARMLGLWLEQREAEAAMIAAQRELEELNRDLERRVEARTAELQRSEATYRALFENSNDAIFLMAPTGEDILFNQNALDLLGYTREEYAALPVAEIIVPEQRTHAYAHLAAALSGAVVPLYERTLVGKDNKLVDVEINLSPVRDPAGNVIMVHSVARDITERKKAQEEIRANRDELRLVNDALEKASRLKDEFLASMSHELRTPLTGILGLAESMQMDVYGALNEKQRNALKNIENSGRHLLELINDILDLSKVEAGKLELEFAPCAASDICRAGLQLVKGLAGQKQIQVSFAINDDALVVNADARRLKQMIVNLLSNAVKFTPERGQVGLTVAGDENAQVVRFTVWDKGIGIEPEQLPKLFRPFVQVDSSLARQYAGTGLGLALVQRMADLHNGRIEVESTPGEGSRFSIILPWPARTGTLQANPVDGSLTAGPTARLAPTMATSGPLVMIADDNAITGEMLADFLTAHGFRVDVVPNGYALLEHAPAVHPDVMLVDIQMPGLDGLEVIRRLRAHHDGAVAAAPILAVTALAMTGDRERCLAAGANEYIAKPIILSDLATQIEALVEAMRSV